MQKALSVFMNAKFAGTLACGKHGLSFQYSRRWLADPAFIPLSLTMPRSAHVYTHRLAYPYFENLLPEATLRKAIAQARGVDSEDVFELLEKTAGDCAGAVSLVLPGSVPAVTSHYTRVEPREIRAWLRNCNKVPLLAADLLRRATLAGSAQKTTVCLRGRSIWRGHANAPTTHVLKPESDKLPQSVANEAFCMTLAADAGLPVASSHLLQCGRRLFLLARSDRVQSRRGIRRLHEIDFCQAGNFSSLRKYEKDGGPGYARLFEIAAQFAAGWPRSRSHLLEWVIFNYLIGNRDTHAKNLSFTLGRDRVRLTPFYDMLCTAIYPEGEKELSLKIGGQNRAHAVTRSNWRRFSRDVKVEWPLVESIACRLAASLPRRAERVAERMSFSLAERRRIHAVLQLLEAQSRHLLRILGAPDGRDD